MRYLMILAAAAFLAVGCHQRTEDEAGAAPDQGDAAVTATDTASVQTDSTTAAVPEAMPTDTTVAAPEAPVAPDAEAEVQPSDVPADSAAAEAPADTTVKQ